MNVTKQADFGSSARVFSLDQWVVGPHASADEAPERLVPATVPGAVQLDWASAEGWGDWWMDGNFRQYGWMESMFWTYRHTIAWPEVGTDERIFLVAEGIDYRYEIRLDGQRIHAQEGMFRAAEVDLTPYLNQGQLLEIMVFPPPMWSIQPWEEARRQADRTCKPPVSYGWDFHPRLVPSGIWQPIRFEVRRPDRIALLDARYELTSDFSEASVTLTALIEAKGQRQVRWQLADPNAQVVAEGSWAVEQGSRFEDGFRLSQPRLWWPHDMGKPERYTLTLSLHDLAGNVLDRAEQRIGFRRTRLVMFDGQFSLDVGIPASQVPPPITLEVNGKKVFTRGSCLTPADVFFGTIEPDRYDALIDLAIGAHYNLLRVWGGGIIPHECFFEMCDARGLMVWQEFPLSCNPYEATPEYLAVLEPEARAIVHRVRRHPSLAIWCGGNELFNYWSGSTMQNRALRLLDSICLELDPLVPFLPTAPIMGMGHGWYAFRHIKTGQDIIEYFQTGKYTAYTEFGCSGASPVEYLRTFIPEADLYPPKPDTAWQWHHGLKAFCEDGIGWLCLPYIEDYFGPCDSLEEIVQGSEWLQCEGIKGAYEEARRQKPYCSMAVSWCFNEPWPSAGNCSLVNWPAMPKPSYFAVRDACRPQMLSLRVQRFDYRPGDTFTAEVWLLNDQYEATHPQTVTVTLSSGGNEIGREVLTLEAGEPNTHVHGPMLSFSLESAIPGPLELRVESAQRPELNSQYQLLLRPSGPAHSLFTGEIGI